MTKRIAHTSASRAHQAHRCPADRAATRKADPAATAPTWHVHTGHLKLIVVGPGEDQWFPCSKSYYSGRVGNIAEREIAAAVVAELNARYPENKDIGREIIDPILREAAVARAIDRRDARAAKRAAKA